MSNLIILILFLLVLSYICSRQNIFSPGVISCSIWLLCLVLWYIIPHPKLPGLNGKFAQALTIWITLLCLGSLSMQSVKFKVTSTRLSPAVRDLYFWLSIACIPFLLWFIWTAIHNGPSSYWAKNLRLAAIGKGSYAGTGEAYTPFYSLLWTATYLLYLIDVNKTNWKRTLISGCLVFAFAIATMSKTLVLNFGLMTLFMLYSKQKLSVRHIMVALVILAFGLLFLHGMRSNKSLSESYVTRITEQYLLRNMPAFETLTPSSAEHNGEHVFRIYYAVAYKLGFSDIEPIDPILPWVMKPIFTNTYTCLYPYFLDYGYWGVGIAALFWGLLIGCFFKCHQEGYKLFTLLYAYFFVMLVTQYNGDTAVTNLAGNIKMIIIICLPFLVGRMEAKRSE